MSKIQWKKSLNPVPYLKALEFMELKVEEIIEQKSPSLIWFLEHPELYTAGTNSSEKDLLSKELPVYLTNRGGKHTYHGPGQRVVYFLLDIEKIILKKDLSKLIYLLEEIIILTLAKIGIGGFRREKFPGVWVEEENFPKKIASIGIRVKKWVCYHGIAINYDPNLAKFSGIIPCGVSDFGVSSITKFTKKYSLEDFDDFLKNTIMTIFSGND